MSYRAPQARGRYGRAHHPECLCDGCMKSYEQHQREHWAGCSCGDCQITNRLMAERQMMERSVSTINMCERPQCGTMGKQAAMAPINHAATGPYAPGGQRGIHQTEVCPGCYAEFLGWWESAPTTARPRAYSEPYDPTTPPPPAAEAIPTEELVRALEARPQAEVQRARYVVTGDASALVSMTDAIEAD